MTDPDGSEALDRALDELYGVDPSEFVARRKALAADLRTAGDKEGAKALLAARRPTTTAWALNRLARTAPDLVDALRERSRELEAAQMGAGIGGRQGVREITQAHRDALGAATDAALAVLGDRATDAFRTQLQASLRAAGADPATGELLRAGRFVKESTGGSGFSEGFTLSLVPDLASSESTATKTAEVAESRASAPARKEALPKIGTGRRADATIDAQDDATARAREERQAAAAREERRRAEAEGAWRAALELADGAEAEAQSADQRVEQLAGELEDARGAARAARERAVTARRDAAKLERAATGKPKPKIHRSCSR